MSKEEWQPLAALAAFVAPHAFPNDLRRAAIDKVRKQVVYSSKSTGEPRIETRSGKLHCERSDLLVWAGKRWPQLVSVFRGVNYRIRVDPVHINIQGHDPELIVGTAFTEPASEAELRQEFRNAVTQLTQVKRQLADCQAKLIAVVAERDALAATQREQREKMRRAGRKGGKAPRGL